MTEGETKDRWDRIDAGDKDRERLIDELAKNVPAWLMQPDAKSAVVVSQIRCGGGKLDLLLLERIGVGGKGGGPEATPTRLRATVLETKAKQTTGAVGQALYYWWRMRSDRGDYPDSDRGKYADRVWRALKQVPRKRARAPSEIEQMRIEGDIKAALEALHFGVVVGAGKRSHSSTLKGRDMSELVGAVEQHAAKKAKDGRYRKIAAEYQALSKREGGVRDLSLVVRVWRTKELESTPGGRRFHALLGAVAVVRDGQVPLWREQPEDMGAPDLSDAIALLDEAADPQICVRCASQLPQAVKGPSSGFRWAVLLHSAGLPSGKILAATSISDSR